jgi:hypothetical protein
MPVALLFLVAYVGYRAGARKYYKVRTKKYNLEGFSKDTLGRPIDKKSGKKLSMNEARALSDHMRKAKEDDKLEREWRSKGNTLPQYGQLPEEESIGDDDGSSTSSIHDNPSQQGPPSQDWRSWNVSGAPCYTEQDEQTRQSLILA